MKLIKPEWFKQKIQATPEGRNVRELLKKLRLNTVCCEALCPNRNSCYAEGTATFLVLGNVCTRNCRFCGIESGFPLPVESDEPERVARAVSGMGLSHVVVTSVTRDDLPDGGAAHFAAIVRAVREYSPFASVELLIPDFAGNAEALEVVLDAKPDVLNHNIETIPDFYSELRPGADYLRSLEILAKAKENGLITKSGMMLGFGESQEQIIGTLNDLAAVEIDILTIGQYLRPGENHYP
ncbi:lipoyl synthase, partial [bacterium]